MNAVEPLALGVIGLARTLGEAWRPASWRHWLVVMAAQLLAIGAIAWGAHPLLSWAVAPALHALTGRDVLHYPMLFQKLASLCVKANLAIAVLLMPVCAGISTRRYAEAFGRTPPRHDRARDAVALVLVGLPAVITAIAVHLALDRLAGVRLSGFTRSLLPPLGTLVLGIVQAATFYVFVDVMLARRGVLGALAAIPRALGRGFVPALVVISLLGLPLVAVSMLEPIAAAGRWRGLPEAAIGVAALRAFLQTAAWSVSAGVATLLYPGGLAPEPEDG